MAPTSTNFFQNWPKLVKIDRFSNFFTFFRSWNTSQTILQLLHVFQVVEHIPDDLTTNIVKNETFSKNSKKSIFGHFLPISATFYEVKITFWKKLVEVGAMTYFQIDVFGIYMLLGIQK
jgi:hypothetical protein